MGLNDLKHISKITSVSAKTSVTKNAKTGTVWKCICQDLEYKVLPSPDGGARHEGIALVMDEAGSIGAFIMVAANPKSTNVTGINARQIFLDTWPLSRWQDEFGTEQAAKFTELTIPSAGNTIAFMEITGPNPVDANNITPESFDGGCVESTLNDTRKSLVEEVMKLKAGLDIVNAPNLANLLLSNHSIFLGSELSWTAGLSVSVSAGKALFKGVEFTHNGGTITGFDDKTLYRALVAIDGTYSLQNENSTEGTSLADYNPSGSGAGQLPTALLAGCTKTGTASVESVTNGVLTLAVSANSCYYTALANAINPSATGAFGEYMLQYGSGSGFQGELDNGTGNGLAVISFFSDRIQAHDGQSFYLDTSKHFSFRYSNKGGKCLVWINGQLALTINSLLASSGSNRVRFGFISSSTGSVNIARIRIRNLASLETGSPSFPALAGAVLGSIVSINSAFSSSIGLRSTTEDINLGHRKEGSILQNSDLTSKNQIISGNWNFNGTVSGIFPPGFMTWWPTSTPPSGWLARNGAAISRTSYASLFTLIGTTYGAGDGSTTFNLPDDRGLFMRGWDNGRGYDSSRSFGSEQTDDLKSHTHTQNVLPGGSGVASGGNFGIIGVSNVGATGGAETRPRNRAYLPIIKF